MSVMQTYNFYYISGTLDNDCKAICCSRSHVSFFAYMRHKHAMLCHAMLCNKLLHTFDWFVIKSL